MTFDLGIWRDGSHWPYLDQGHGHKKGKRLKSAKFVTLQANSGRKANENWKMSLSTSQPKIHGRLKCS